MEMAARVRLASVVVLALNGVASLPAEACFICTQTENACLPGNCEATTPEQKYGVCVQINPRVICTFVHSWTCTPNWPFCDEGSGSLLTCKYSSGT